MRRRRKRNPISVPVASIGDIAFLLIIFFILCSNLKEDEIRLTLPTDTNLAEQQRGPLRVNIDEEGVIYFQGQRVDDADAIESMLSGRIRPDAPVKERTVLFRCDRNVDKRVFEPVIDAIARSGGLIAAIGTEQGAQQ